jgi:hypothetical protein
MDLPQVRNHQPDHYHNYHAQENINPVTHGDGRYRHAVQKNGKVPVDEVTEDDNKANRSLTISPLLRHQLIHSTKAKEI